MKGLKNCKDIFSQNIKGYFIGPYDLSASLNNPGAFDTDEFYEAEAKILSAAKEENIKCGYHLVEPEKHQIKVLQAKGYDMIAFSVDIRMLDIGARLPFTQ
jgi:2-dehydro-3-deoxyglucarate aldolase